jgi:hypothetical protein
MQGTVAEKLVLFEKESGGGFGNEHPGDLAQGGEDAA